MFKLLANIFGYVLNFIYGIVNNYGVAIIIFTILLRLILLPMNIKQQKNMKKSAKIQSKMQELQDKYSNDAVRLNQEIQNLYKEENMSPFSGCLSSILQLIIIVSMFMLVANPLTYMKHLPEEQIDGYEEQLEQMEITTTNSTEIAIIKNLSDTEEDVNINMDFLGLDLSDIPSQNYSDISVFIIPILYVITSIISMKISTQSLSNKNKNEKVEVTKEEEKLMKVDDKNNDLDAMEAMNKNMRYMMPIMSTMVALIAPLGLALYWFVSNVVMILERIIARKVIKDKE